MRFEASASCRAPCTPLPQSGTQTDGHVRFGEGEEGWLAAAEEGAGEGNHRDG